MVGFHCILYMYGVILICCHFNMYRPAIKHDVESSCVADEPQVSLQICRTESLLHYSLTHLRIHLYKNFIYNVEITQQHLNFHSVLVFY